MPKYKILNSINQKATTDAQNLLIPLTQRQESIPKYKNLNSINQKQELIPKYKNLNSINPKARTDAQM